MHKLTLLLPLMFIIFVSGCTDITQPIIVTGGGLVITDFEPQLTEAYSTEEVTFEARIRNDGILPAEMVYTEIVGIEDWDLVLDNTPDCTYGFALIPADVQSGTEGQTKMCSWIYEAPEIPYGLDMPYNPTLRVYYSYFSNTIHTVSIVPRAELRRLKNSGQSLPVAIESSSGGPISISVDTEPILSFETSAIFPVKITVTNTDIGIACYPEDCRYTDNWNKVRLSFKLDDRMRLLDCGNMELSLYKGDTNSVVCKIEAFDIPENSISKRSIELKAEYSYIIDKETQIKVLAEPS